MIVDVVSAVIVRERRILLTQRPPTKDFPFTWECPGGKIEQDEILHDAISRELYEEIGVHAIGVSPFIWRGEFKNIVQRESRAHVRVSLHPVWIDAQEPKPLEGQGIGWFTADEMLRLSLAPANHQALFLLAMHVAGPEEDK